jgi:hypothetical protein
MERMPPPTSQKAPLRSLMAHTVSKIGGVPVPCPLQVHDVDVSGAAGDKILGNGGGIGAVNRHFGVIPPQEAHRFFLV